MDEPATDSSRDVSSDSGADPSADPNENLITTTSVPEEPTPFVIAPAPGGVDPRALRIADTVYKEKTRYDVSGPLAALVVKGQEYLDSVTGGVGTTLVPNGLATDLKPDRILVDSSWSLSQVVSSPIPGAPPINVEGVLKIRIAAIGTPVLRKKKGVAGVAKNYKGIKDYAIGLNFDATNDAFDSDLVITYSNPGRKRYVLTALAGKSVSELVNVKKVTSVAASGPLAPTLAGAIDLATTPPFVAASSAFSSDLGTGWPSAANGWVL